MVVQMKKYMSLLALTILLSTSNGTILSQELLPKITYEIDLSNPVDDLFHVAVNPVGLSSKDSIFCFVSIVPGTYSISNFGRFVKTFNAYDIDGTILETRKKSTNQWVINSPERISKIVYDIEDSFDSQVENNISPMGGTGIQDDFIILNPFGVLGYFRERQTDSVKLKIEYKSGWEIGTSLQQNKDGYYFADSYDRLADSPILIGELSYAKANVNKIDVGIYIYSPDSNYRANNILQLANNMLESAGKFINYDVVPYYNFLLAFLDEKAYDKIGIYHSGALEHSYSSLYYFPIDEERFSEIKPVMAHEFLHILTPLNLHSDVLYPFDFQNPNASEHIWLYEGVIEWASDIMLLRSGDMTLDEYLSEMSRKLKFNDFFAQDISLSHMSMEVFDREMGRHFSNFYNKGTITAMCLDLELLRLSNGTRGLREVFFDLLKNYGSGKSFPEKEFFDIIVDYSYPEISQFIENYIKGTVPLPIKEYMDEVGIEYINEMPSEDVKPTFGYGIRFNDNDEYFTGRLEQRARNIGINDGDQILRIFDIEINSNTIKHIFSKRDLMKAGDSYEVVVKRNGENIELHPVLFKKMKRHIFKEKEILTEGQKHLRERWGKNLSQ